MSDGLNREQFETLSEKIIELIFDECDEGRNDMSLHLVMASLSHAAATIAGYCVKDGSVTKAEAVSMIKTLRTPMMKSFEIELQTPDEGEVAN